MDLVVIWLTNKCNLDCKYCYIDEKKSQNMLKEKGISIISYIDSIYDGKKIKIRFHGGEPFLNFEIMKDIVEGLYRKGIKAKYYVTTNATVLNKRHIEFLKIYDFDLAVSLDGVEETNDKNRVTINGEGTHKRVIESMKLLKKEGIPFSIRGTFDSISVSDLYENTKYLYKLNFTEKVLINPNYFDKEWNEKALQILEENLLKIYYLDRKEEELGNNPVFSMLHEETLDIKGICGGGISEINIDTEGDIYPCTYAVGKKDMILGNISIGINKSIIESLDEIYRKRNSECNGCNYEKRCIASKCKFLNKAITGEYCIPAVSICGVENAILNAYLEYNSNN